LGDHGDEDIDVEGHKLCSEFWEPV